MRALQLTVVSVVSMALAVGALAEDEGKKADEGKRPARKSILEQYDGKGDGGVVDGKITVEEYKAGAAESAERRFKAMDKDQDGALTEQELLAERRSRRKNRGHGGGDKTEDAAK